MTAAVREKVKVDLGERSYDIVIGEDLLAEAGSLLKPLLRQPKLAIVTDEHVAPLHLEPLKKSLQKAQIGHHAVVLPAGEKTKSYASLETLCDSLLAQGLERGHAILALGGGVIGDLAGFAAAILLRGLPFIQCPTTLLAQVDSSVGGKTGINSALGKNLIGAFHQPLLVLADTRLLDTLPPRELRAGYAEIVKYGLLGDRSFFEWLERMGMALLKSDAAARTEAITVSCRAKAAIVSMDETEEANRALLNLGHTFGHALEAASGFSDQLLHGEAVAIGMAMAFRLSARLGLCSAAESERASRHLASVGLPTRPREIKAGLPSAADIFGIMRQDKKSRAGSPVFILVRGIGKAFLARDIAEQDVLDFLAIELS